MSMNFSIVELPILPVAWGIHVNGVLRDVISSAEAPFSGTYTVPLYALSAEQVAVLEEHAANRAAAVSWWNSRGTS